MRELDPVTLAVLNGRLVQIADEMDATLYRSAFNPIIAEAHDACHGLYHAETGATLVQGTSGLPIFVGAMAFAVKAVIDKAARDGDLTAGDTYLFNDPYDGGTHLNDIRLVRPLMRNGRVFAWLASVGHWLDVGGNVPGNFNAKATESFQEGFRVPPVKLIRDGVLQQASSIFSPPIRACRNRTAATSTAGSMRSISVRAGSKRCSTNMATTPLRPRSHSFLRVPRR